MQAKSKRIIKRATLLIVITALTAAVLLSQTNSEYSKSKDAVTLPQIKQNGAVKQMFVDGNPFIMLSGELHNSSASCIEYKKPIWDKLADMNLNTVVSTVSWELLEPEEVFIHICNLDCKCFPHASHSK